MSKHIFLCRTENEGKKTCIYISPEAMKETAANGSIRRCVRTSFSDDPIVLPDYADVETPLTRLPYDFIKLYCDFIEDADAHPAMMQHSGMIRHITAFAQAASDVARALQIQLATGQDPVFSQIVKEEQEALCKKWYETEEYGSAVLSLSPSGFIDRDAIRCIYRDKEQFGRAAVGRLSGKEDAVYSIPPELKDYIDYARYGADVLERREDCYQIGDRIVKLYI
jgi:hypothetical protein